MSAAIRTVRIANPKAIATVADRFPCDAAAAVGDFVRASDSIAGGVDVAADNTDKRPVIGLIIKKINSTTAQVLLLGKVTGFTGLTQGDTLFLSASGGVTASPVAGGYHQVLGAAIDSDTIIFNPQLRVVRRNP